MVYNRTLLQQQQQQQQQQINNQPELQCGMARASRCQTRQTTYTGLG